MEQIDQLDENPNYRELATLSSVQRHDIVLAMRNLQDVIAFNNFEKGWRVDPEFAAEPVKLRPVGELVALMHSEVTECFEAYRNNEPYLWYEYNLPQGQKTKPDHPWATEPLSPSGIGAEPFLGKPQGMASELADVIIRVLDMADELEIPVVDAILRKHAYNQTRPYRHGGKKA